MKRAIELSRHSMESDSGGPFGSVITRDQKIVAEGQNRVTSTNDPTAHGEMVAIRAACQKLQTFDLNGCEIYTSCEPCPMCLAAIYWANLDKIYFANTKEDARRAGFNDEAFYQELAREPRERSIPSERLEGEEGAAVFADWIARENKTLY